MIGGNGLKIDMIIGNGLIATSFVKFNNNDCVVFASGVSNSQETNSLKYNRERNLLLEIIEEYKHFKIIYFSSVLVGCCNSIYYNHKMEMERLIETNADNYIIFRIPQLIGRIGNKNNIINYLKKSINDNKKITILKDVERSLVDIDDLVSVVDFCKNINNEIIYLSYIEKISILDLVNKIADILNKKPIIEINKYTGSNWYFKNSLIVELFLARNDYTNYTDRILNKYMGNQ